MSTTSATTEGAATTEHASALRRARVFPAPAAGFDPHTASEAALIRHGFPPRPDPTTDPRRAKLWQRAFSAPVTYRTAELSVDPAMSKRRLPTRRQGADFDIESNWAGVAQLAVAEPITMVYARWVVPQVIGVIPGADDATVGIWVGIDGSPEAASLSAQTQVLQAGIAITVDAGHFGNTVRYWAFTEWFTEQFQDSAVQVDNFPVEPGDVISVLVCAPTPDTAHFSFVNSTKGIATSHSIDAPGPPGAITSMGESAEWIVEQVDPVLPYFHYVLFFDCLAGDPARTVDLLPDGEPISIIDDDNGNPPFDVLAEGLIISPTMALVAWDRFT